MARGRFISNSISASKKFARLKNDTHRLMYLMLVTHADAEGRHDADARVLKGKVYTLLDVASADIERALADMRDAGLIDLYSARGERYVEVTDFHKHNKIRRDASGMPSHEAASECPPNPRAHNPVPTTEPLRSNYVPTTAQVEVEVEVQVQDEVQPQPQEHPAAAAAAADMSELHRAEASRLARRHDHRVLQSNYPDVWRTLGELTSAFGWREPQFRKIAEKLLSLVREHGPHKVIAGADKVLLNASNVRNPVAFLEAVLTADARASTAGAPSPLTSDDALERLFGVN
jgi:hypothetical protein